MLISGVLALASPVAVGAACVVAGAIASLLLVATLAGRDLWPFSHYPMFAGAMEGTAVRFFRLQVHFADGRTAELTGLADALVDPFHRECERLWAAGQPAAAEVEAAALRAWREASRLEPELAGARSVEVMMRIAQPVPDGRILLAEKTVHRVAAEESGRAE